MRKIKIFRFLSIALLVFLTGCATTKNPNSESLTTAENAFASAEYAKAFQLLVPLAKAGNTKAEYALGYLYYTGKGTESSIEAAKFWMRRAALKGNKSAINALAKINNSEIIAPIAK